MRPAYYSPEIIKEAAIKLLPEIKIWLNEDTTEDILENIITVIENNLYKDFDAYKMAKDFDDDFGYDVDSSFVDIMDSVWSIYNKIYNEKIKSWILENNIQPKYKINDEVNVSIKDKKYSGIITHIDEKHANYTVYVKELHNKEKGVLGVVKHFEDIES